MIVSPADVKKFQAAIEAKMTRKEYFARLKDMADFITQNPSYYMAFGPYWWTFKELVRRHVGGEKVVRWAGDYDDTDTRKRYTTGDDFYDLVAAMTYQADHSGNIADAPQRHNVADEDMRDTTSVDLYDPDLHRG